MVHFPSWFTSWISSLKIFEFSSFRRLEIGKWIGKPVVIIIGVFVAQTIKMFSTQKMVGIQALGKAYFRFKQGLQS